MTDWKDTVMNKERLDAIDLKNAESNFTDALWDVAREQDEISFKVGIKEVVEWIRSHQLIEPDEDSITRFEPFYQIAETNLKNWGIE